MALSGIATLRPAEKKFSYVRWNIYIRQSVVNTQNLLLRASFREALSCKESWRLPAIWGIGDGEREAGDTAGWSPAPADCSLRPGGPPRSHLREFGEMLHRRRTPS